MNRNHFYRLHEAVSAFPNAMDLSTLHGFLTGVAIGPYEARRSPWLKTLLGVPEKTPINALSPQLESLASEALDEIVDEFLDDAFEPQVEVELRGSQRLPRTDLWCRGFIDSVALAEDAWESRTEASRVLAKLLLFLNVVAEPRQFVDVLFTESVDPDDSDFLAEVRALAGPTVTKLAGELMPELKQADAWNDQACGTGDDLQPELVAEELAILADADLMALVTGMAEALPRSVVDACARRPSLLPRLAGFLGSDKHWRGDVPEEIWWGLLHCVNIVGAMGSEQAARVLSGVFDKMEAYPENELWEWLNGYWPALFRNKREEAREILMNVAEDKCRPEFVRVEAIECLLEAKAAQGCDHLEVAIDWVARMAVDRWENDEMVYQAALLLLDFPRRRHRRLLESLVQRQKMTLGGIVYFSMDDIEAAFEEGDKREWEQFENPWELYEPRAIAERLRDEPAAEAATPQPVEFAHAARHGPCPCGSGRAFDKCCLH